MSAARQLSRHLKELRIHLCQTSSASKGAREFISANYTTLKSANPDFPILIRECSGIQPRVIGRYAYGREEKIVLSDMSANEVDQAINSLAAGPSTN
ncbi:Oidioi.mRNA.OKI2018_I69.chr2.g6350.t1.cds [Oikopleura dioica]|uniref:NADH dehydrogenase [ubiquinone] 1 alpha subcomplex subunit 2 n=1 Tax=Oikopleura dioica TaxID=34765 RepID=A0ABN7T348_OIKDI|nr:Oidioi.mRNA.OKI2018_I69.chr2.g6350.t1.cds [Oikopleura dioica]